MNDYCTAKKCCLICEYATIEDIDDIDQSIPCTHPENVTKSDLSVWVDQDHVCKHFMLNTILTEAD